MQNDEHQMSEKETAAEQPAPAVESLAGSAVSAEQLRRMPNLVARGLIYLVTILVLVFFLYSLIARIDVVAECRSVVLPSTNIMRILADRNGYIDQILVAEGETVRPGAPLFRIRSKETVGYVSKTDDLRERMPLTERNFDLKISAAVDRRAQHAEKHENALKVNALKLEQNTLNISSLDSDISYWRNEMLLLSDEVDRLKKGRERGYASLPEYNNAVSGLERARTEEKKLIAQKQIAAREREILQEEIRREQFVFENELAQLNKEIENLELEKKSALQTMQNELTLNRTLLGIQKNASPDEVPGDQEPGAFIRAETEGVVSEMRFRNPGEYVAISDLLCTLVPAGSPLYVVITVDNKDIGFIEEGMTVKYKFDAFPYTDYGMLAGQVAVIAPSAVENPARGFVYHIRGSLPRPYFTIRDRKYPIRAGMTVSAEVVTERISLFSLLFRKLKK